MENFKKNRHYSLLELIFVLFHKIGCERSPSFKERHPKFRKSSTPDYMVALESARNLKRQTSLQSEPSDRMDTSSPNNNSMPEDVPLDMSIRKRPNTPPPPPQYR